MGNMEEREPPPFENSPKFQMQPTPSSPLILDLSVHPDHLGLQFFPISLKFTSFQKHPLQPGPAAGPCSQALQPGPGTHWPTDSIAALLLHCHSGRGLRKG